MISLVALELYDTVLFALNTTLDAVIQMIQFNHTTARQCKPIQCTKVDTPDEVTGSQDDNLLHELKMADISGSGSTSNSKSNVSVPVIRQ